MVIYVVIDEPNADDQAQSAFAVQLARDIMDEIFPYLGITKIPGSENTTAEDEMPEDTDESYDAVTSDDAS